jgi:hypothetical protein
MLDLPTIMIERVEEHNPARTGILSIVRIVSRRSGTGEMSGFWRGMSGIFRLTRHLEPVRPGITTGRGASGAAAGR